MGMRIRMSNWNKNVHEEIRRHVIIGVGLTTLLLGEDQIIVVKCGIKLQETVYKLNQAVGKYTLNISSKKKRR
jgi:hypothetical protein